MNIRGPWRRKGFEITVHKDEGYLADGTRIHFVLPDEGVRFDQGGVLYWTYKTDDGIELPWTNIGDRNNFAIGGNIRDLTINGVSLYNQQVTAMHIVKRFRDRNSAMRTSIESRVLSICAIIR